jgi:hypothetical protein
MTTNFTHTMGSPTSDKVAKIFLQHFEQFIVKHMLDDQNLKFYTRYVDNTSILIISDSSTLTEHTIIQLKQIHPNIEFRHTIK